MSEPAAFGHGLHRRRGIAMKPDNGTAVKWPTLIDPVQCSNSCRRQRLAASVRADSFPTLKLVERVGVLDHPAARPAFVEQKLID